MAAKLKMLDKCDESSTKRNVKLPSYLKSGHGEEVGAEEVPGAVGEEDGAELPLLGADGAHQPDGQARLQHRHRRRRHLQEIWS